MATYDFDATTRTFFTERLQRITEATPRLWGKLDAAHALRHLTFTFEMSLGEVDVRSTVPAVPGLRSLLYLVFFRWFTDWPKGRMKAPSFTCPPPRGDFAQEAADLSAAMDRFLVALAATPQRREINPGLGKITLERWSRVHGVHTDHHFRQFGV